MIYSVSRLLKRIFTSVGIASLIYEGQSLNFKFIKFQIYALKRSHILKFILNLTYI